MATARLYINNQLVLEDIASDMMSMLGFEDTEETKYLDISSLDKPIEKAGPMCKKGYLIYYGNEDVFLTVTKNRNLLIFVRNDFDKSSEHEEYDYLVKMFTFNSRLTELSIPSINLFSTKCIDTDEIHISFQMYTDEKVDIFLSISL